MQTKHIFNIGLPLLVVLTVIFASISNDDNSVFQSFAVLTGCIAFHLVIWILSATIVVGIMRNKANDKFFLFRELSWEKKFYQFIRIRSWKHHLPTYAPKYYDFKSLSHTDLLGIISQTEVVHEVASLLSLVSLFGIIWFGHTLIFTTIAAIDLMTNLVYIILQRYNRMRLRKLIKIQL